MRLLKRVMIMSRLKVFILLIIGFAQISFGQIQPNDSTEAYNYWAQRGVIEAIYSYMEDYVVTVGDKITNQEKSGKENYFKKFVEKINSEEPLPTFDVIGSFLKENDWSKTENLILLPLKEKIKKKDPLNKDFFNFYNGNNLLTTGESIISRYEESLKTIKERQDSVSPQIESQVSTTDREEESSNNVIIWFGLILIILGIFILGFLIGSFFIYILSKKNIYSILKIEKDDYHVSLSDENKKFAFKYIGIVYILRKHKDKYKNEVKNIRKENENLKLELKYLKEEKNNILKEKIELGKKIKSTRIENKSNYIEQKPSQEIITTEQVNHSKKIFFSMPNSDGSFQVSNSEPENDGSKYFKIEFEESSNQGELYYLPSERDKKAINRLEAFLKPVCDISNIVNSASATKIELIQKGEVSLVNDKWVIDTNNKVKIKLY